MDARIQQLIEAARNRQTAQGTTDIIEANGRIDATIRAVQSMPPGPAWHRQPTCEGWWCDEHHNAYYWGAGEIIRRNEAKLGWTFSWYLGPIPPKPEEEAGAASEESDSIDDHVAAIRDLQKRLSVIELRGVEWMPVARHPEEEPSPRDSMAVLRNILEDDDCHSATAVELDAAITYLDLLDDGAFDKYGEPIAAEPAPDSPFISVLCPCCRQNFHGFDKTLDMVIQCCCGCVLNIDGEDATITITPKPEPVSASVQCPDCRARFSVPTGESEPACPIEAAEAMRPEAHTDGVFEAVADDPERILPSRCTCEKCERLLLFQAGHDLFSDREWFVVTPCQHCLDVANNAGIVYRAIKDDRTRGAEPSDESNADYSDTAATHPAEAIRKLQEWCHKQAIQDNRTFLKMAERQTRLELTKDRLSRQLAQLENDFQDAQTMRGTEPAEVPDKGIAPVRDTPAAADLEYVAGTHGKCGKCERRIPPMGLYHLDDGDVIWCAGCAEIRGVTDEGLPLSPAE